MIKFVFHPQTEERNVRVCRLEATTTVPSSEIDLVNSNAKASIFYSRAVIGLKWGKTTYTAILTELDRPYSPEKCLSETFL